MAIKKENIKISDQKTTKPNNGMQIIVDRIMHEFYEMELMRNTSYKYFGFKGSGGYKNLIDYIDDSQKRLNSQGIPRENLEAWQANVFKPETRKKLIAMISQFASRKYNAKFTGKQENDFFKSIIIEDIYNWTNYKEDASEKLFWMMWQAMGKGTSIAFEGYNEQKRNIRDIENVDFETGDIKYKEKVIFNKYIYSEVIPTEDFYPGSLRIFSIKDLSKCIWRTVKRFGDVKAEYGNYPNFKYVLPGGDIYEEGFFYDYVNENIQKDDGDLVEVIRYFNKEKDEFIIILNGVWINPDKRNKIKPLPWNHKELPFWTLKFEPFSHDFFYGKSLPDKFMHEQDAINALLNMSLDQLLLSVNPPMLVGEADALEDVNLVPGRVSYVGASINEFKELNISKPGSAHFGMIKELENSIEGSSVSSVMQGQVGSKSTATEILQAREAASRIASLFERFILWGLKEKAQLRVANIMQFLTKSKQIEKIIDENNLVKYKETFETFRINNTKYKNGGIGTRVIKMVNNKNELPNKKELENEAKIEGIEKIVITPDYIRNFEVDIIIEPESDFEQSLALKIATEHQFQALIYQLYGDMVDRDKMFEEFVKVYKKDPELIRKQKAVSPQKETPVIQNEKQIMPMTNIEQGIIKQNIPETQRGKKPLIT